MSKKAKPSKPVDKESSGLSPTQKLIEFLTEAARHEGYAASTVSDGHLIMLRTDVLQGIVENHSNEEMILMFIKRNDMKS